MTGIIKQLEGNNSSKVNGSITSMNVKNFDLEVSFRRQKVIVRREKMSTIIHFILFLWIKNSHFYCPREMTAWSLSLSLHTCRHNTKIHRTWTFLSLQNANLPFCTETQIESSSYFRGIRQKIRRTTNKQNKRRRRRRSWRLWKLAASPRLGQATPLLWTPLRAREKASSTWHAFTMVPMIAFL